MSKRIKLMNLLKESHIDHKTRIMKESNLKDVFIYCKLNKLSGPVFGCLVESYIQKQYNLKKDTSNNGDLIFDKKGHKEHIEIKASNGGKYGNRFNFVQIRLNHDCIFTLIAYYLNKSNIDKFGELFIFKLTKTEMTDFVLKHGQYAHGTIGRNGSIDVDNLQLDKEYALRPRYGDDCWKDLLKFRSDNILDV